MDGEGGRVIYLAFRAETVEDDQMAFVACSHCRNKTFVVLGQPGDFPLMRCAACQSHIGNIGWAPGGDE